MRIRWKITLWDSTVMCRQVTDLKEALRKHEWTDITAVHLEDLDGLDKEYVITQWDEAARHAEYATSVADRCVWIEVARNLEKTAKKLGAKINITRKPKITEVKIL